jgi:hypothetical protein
MARGPCTFRQRDLTAALKAANAAGCDVQLVVIDKQGRIVLEMGNAGATSAALGKDRNEWDDG